MESPISLSVETGFSFFLALGVVYMVQGIKYILQWLPTTRTNNLPSWLWVVIALVVGCITCYFLKVDALEKILQGAGVPIGPPWSYLATGFAIGVSSNVMFAVTKPLRKKIRTDEGKIVTLDDSQSGSEYSQSGITGAEMTSDVINAVKEQTGDAVCDGHESQQIATDADSSIQPVSATERQLLDSASRLADESTSSNGHNDRPGVVKGWPTAKLLRYVPLEGATYYIALGDDDVREVK